MELRKANILLNGILAGKLEETENGFMFSYISNYLTQPSAKAISLTLPLSKQQYLSKALFPFFCGLLAEGVNKATQCRTLKIDENDLFGLLLATGEKDTIGAVTVKEIKK